MVGHRALSLMEAGRTARGLGCCRGRGKVIMGNGERSPEKRCNGSRRSWKQDGRPGDLGAAGEGGRGHWRKRRRVKAELGKV
jgi:hypothetical protein